MDPADLVAYTLFWPAATCTEAVALDERTGRRWGLTRESIQSSNGDRQCAGETIQAVKGKYPMADYYQETDVRKYSATRRGRSFGPAMMRQNLAGGALYDYTRQKRPNCSFPKQQILCLMGPRPWPEKVHMARWGGCLAGVWLDVFGSAARRAVSRCIDQGDWKGPGVCPEDLFP